jgi:hypothetical protein
MNALTVESLKTILGREVEEVVLTVAKSSVFGLDSATIAESLGTSKAEIDSLMLSEDYKDIRLLVGAEHQKEKVERDSGWDGLEATALSKLQRRVNIESDTETLLKIAAVANKAQRRTAPQREMSPLDAGSASQRIPLTLTKRYTEKLQAGEVVERTETQQISVLNGSAVSPSFTEVQNALASAARTPGEIVQDSENQGPNGLPQALSRKQKALNLADAVEKGYLGDGGH